MTGAFACTVDAHFLSLTYDVASRSTAASWRRKSFTVLLASALTYISIGDSESSLCARAPSKAATPRTDVGSVWKSACRGVVGGVHSGVDGIENRVVGAVLIGQPFVVLPALQCLPVCLLRVKVANGDGQGWID
jgi:hypothetical protein